MKRAVHMASVLAWRSTCSFGRANYNNIFATSLKLLLFAGFQEGISRFFGWWSWSNIEMRERARAIICLFSTTEYIASIFINACMVQNSMTTHLFKEEEGVERGGLTESKATIFCLSPDRKITVLTMTMLSVTCSCLEKSWA
jgi:hypothetical protein